jgi:two-component system, LytTR family, response regulator LytT
MRLLIVEDEPPIADYIEKKSLAILGDTVAALRVEYTLEKATEFLAHNRINLCLLDLNLSGDDGFELLKRMSAGPFQTVIISAYSERAIEAFEYGVLDFIEKPFSEARLRQAFDRYFGTGTTPGRTRYLVARRQNRNHVVHVEEITHFTAVRYLVEAHLDSGAMELLEKPLNLLERMLPVNFVRIHRSHIVNLDHLASYRHVGGSVYEVELADGTLLPLSRSRYRELHELLNK